jgi:hypothetical protein
VRAGPEAVEAGDEKTADGLFAVALVVSGMAGRLEEPYGEGIRWIGRGLLVLGLVLLLFAPLSFSAP